MGKRVKDLDARPSTPNADTVFLLDSANDGSSKCLLTDVGLFAIPAGLLSARPAAGNAGAYYLTTDSGAVALYRDNGVSWDSMTAPTLAAVIASGDSANYIGFNANQNPSAPSGLALVFYSTGGKPYFKDASTTFELLHLDASAAPDNKDILTYGSAAGAMSNSGVKLSGYKFIGAKQYGFAAATEITVASGFATLTQGWHKLQPESGTADDITDVDGLTEGQWALVYVSDDGTDTLTWKHGTGNLSIIGGADLEQSTGAVLLISDGTTVYVMGGGASGGSMTADEIMAELAGATAIDAIADDDVLGVADDSAAGAAKAGTFTQVWTWISGKLAALTGKTTPVDADTLNLVDSEASSAQKSLTFANLWVWAMAKIAGVSTKATPVDADSIALVDSEASNVLKRVTIAALKTVIGALTSATSAKGLAVSGSGVGMSSSNVSGTLTAIADTGYYAWIEATGGTLYRALLNSLFLITRHSTNVPSGATAAWELDGTANGFLNAALNSVAMPQTIRVCASIVHDNTVGAATVGLVLDQDTTATNYRTDGGNAGTTDNTYDIGTVPQGGTILLDMTIRYLPAITAGKQYVSASGRMIPMDMSGVYYNFSMTRLVDDVILRYIRFTVDNGNIQVAGSRAIVYSQKLG